MFTAGWKTSEFWKSLGVIATALGGAAALLTTADWQSVSEAYAKGGISLGLMALAGFVLRIYVNGRTAVKVAEANYLAAAKVSVDAAVKAGVAPAGTGEWKNPTEKPV